MKHTYLRVALLNLVTLLLVFSALPSLPVLATRSDGHLLRHQVARLVAADGEEGDFLGFSIAIDGDIAVVGEPNDSERALEAGAAYLFQRDPLSGSWNQLTKLTASDPCPYCDFGRAVAIFGDTVAVSADVVSPGGAVYIFQRDLGGANAWGLLARIRGLDTTWGDRFGYDLALDGDTLLVGAYAGGDYDGRAYIFYRDQGGPDAWGQVAMIVGSQVLPYDYFGSAVDVSGDTAIVGACGDNGIVGSAYIFQRDQGGPDAWGEVLIITPTNPVPHGWFGLPVTIDGDTAVISGQGYGPDGTAFIHYRNQGGPNAWGLVGEVRSDEPQPESAFGVSLAVLSDTLAVGAPNLLPGGAVYLFARHEGGPDRWGRVARLEADDAGPAAELGSAVALSGNLLAAGAPGNTAIEPDALTGAVGGSAYLFWLPNTPPGGLVITGTAAPVDEGSLLLLTGHLIDPDQGETLTVTVEWGDGDGTLAPLGGSRPDYTFSATHSYADGPNSYPITVTVADLEGATAVTTTTVTVNNVPPTLNELPDQALDLGQPLTMTATLIDPGVLDSHTVVVQWDDATSQTIALAPGQAGVTVTHVYTMPGTYTVTVDAADDDAGKTRGTFTATVYPVYYTIYLPVVGKGE